MVFPYAWIVLHCGSALGEYGRAHCGQDLPVNFGLGSVHICNLQSNPQQGIRHVCFPDAFLRQYPISQPCAFVSKIAKTGGLHSHSAEGSKSKREKKNSGFLWQLDEKNGKTKLKNISLPGLFYRHWQNTISFSILLSLGFPGSSLISG